MLVDWLDPDNDKITLLLELEFDLIDWELVDDVDLERDELEIEVLDE